MLTSVPVIDLNDFFKPASKESFIQELGDSIKYFGFIRIKGHNVNTELTEPSYQVAKDFFSLPEEIKNQYIVSGGKGQRGYTPYLAESAKGADLPDLKEFWHTGRELPKGHPLSAVYPENVWPQEIKNFKDVMLSLYTALEECSDILLRAIALYLGQPEDTFTKLTSNGNSILRSLHYPALTDREVVQGSIRAASHEDINFITLLITSTSSGLQLKTREGNWLNVNAEPGEIVADSGDMLSRVTNGVIPSTTHRVINPDDSTKARYSMPFFVHPTPEAILSVLDNCKGEGFPEPQPDITGIDFLNERLEDLGLNKI